MSKKTIILGSIALVSIMVGCSKESKMDYEEIEDITYQESVINDIYNDVQDNIETIDGYIECKYENKNVDSDDFRECQKEMRKIVYDIEDININEIKEYYTNKNDLNKYNSIKNKYNQISRSVRYVEGISDMLKDDNITDDEAMDWICMKEICNSESPLSDEIKDSDEYEHIVEEYGFSLLDKQNEFDKKYGVEDID